MRLFAGIEIGDDAKDAAGALIDACRRLELRAKYEAREKQHITVAFLGATADEQLAEVGAGLREAAAKCEPFSVLLDTVGAFPNARRPRLLWLGSSKPNPKFAACARGVRDAFRALGWKFDDEPIAHVTFCRCKQPLNRMPELAVAQPVRVAVRQVGLFQSTPAGATTRYEVLLRVPLGHP